MINPLFTDLYNIAKENEKKLPNLKDFPISEHTLLITYSQTYIITLIGLPTASLIMQGYLMEVFVKYFYFHHKKMDFKEDLWKLIETCYKENLFSNNVKLNEQYYNFFEGFRKIRNQQIHFLTKKQTKGMEVKGMKIKIPKDSEGNINFEEFMKTVQEAKENFSKKSEFLSADENPVIANVLKFEIDKNGYIKQFIELNKVILELNKEHNLDYKND